MKKALNAWTVDYALTMEEAFAAVSAAGFEGIELNIDAPGSPHSLSMESTAADYEAIRALSKKHNLPVCSISTSQWGDKMGNPVQWEAAKALLFKQIEAAKALGADGILTVPGGMNEQITLKTARENSIAFLKANKEQIEKEGIFVGVENVWNGFFLSPYDMNSFIDEVDSPQIGAYLDAGNMLAFSVPQYWVEILGSRIGKLHVKDYKLNGGLNSGGTWEDLTHGSADWKIIISELRKAGYDGYVVGEVFKAEKTMSYDDYYKKVCGELAQIISY